LVQICRIWFAGTSLQRVATGNVTERSQVIYYSQNVLTRFRFKNSDFWDRDHDHTGEVWRALVTAQSRHDCCIIPFDGWGLSAQV